MQDNDNNIIPIAAHVVNEQQGTKPVPEIVAILRATLAEAERGEIIGVGVVGVTGGSALVMRYHANCNASAMLAAGILMWETIKGMFMEASLQSSYVDETPEDYPPA